MVKTILVLASNPKNTLRLRLDQEVREIYNGLQRAQRKDEFILRQQWASRPIDIRRAMLDHNPIIVHFCGHGEEDGIAFEDELGYARIVKTEALTEFFELFSDNVECVLMNACYSKIQARAIAKHINYVVGMEKEVGDAAAIEFAAAFYDALGAGKSFEFAFRFGRNAIQMLNNLAYAMPKLIKKNVGELFIAPVQERSASQDEIEREIYNFRSFYSSSKKTGINVHIYWHQQGLTLEDASAMKIEFEKEGIPTAILKHRDPKPPDSVFIGTLVSAQEARIVLSKIPYNIEYIFPANYPRIEGGDPNGLLIGIGYMSGHSQENRVQASTPIKVSKSDVASLIETGISNVEFQRRLQNLIQAI
ncbi:MAG: CHAT domain-containing protein [Synechococcales cyanobacterium K44_A2020_017]|nr:CHAT domain-containing protein [Synechococcales cyanobacterium K32_A2020_035]MBF2094998.1 CHAT domain-containing protein [Synechococcales cyanobacterium K44_A2020_017]